MSRARVLLALAGMLAAGAAVADTAQLAAGPQRLDFALQGALPVAWESCAARCEPGERRAVFLGIDADGGEIAYTGADPARVARFAALRYDGVVLRADGVATLRLKSLEPFEGRVREHRWRINGGGHALTAELDLPAGIGLRIATSAALVPEPMPGFGSIYGRVRGIHVGADGQAWAEPGAARDDGWIGTRSRFWALAWRAPAGEPGAVLAVPEENRPQWALPGGAPLRLGFYAGPVASDALAAVDPVLRGMLFAALWEPLRWLTFAMLWLLDALRALIGSTGLAIIALSLVVKILMFPLTRIAERWQDEVNAAEARIAPKIAAVRAAYRGEEAHNRILGVYREENVHPMYTLKSAAGFLIQIPVFIAAFDMLAENFALNQTAFLWVADLARPDAVATLPFALPFFGAQLNLLPFLMTGLTIAASLLQRDASLTPELAARQRMRLYLMAAAFFVLFYTFPAGMVLYWTSNNLFHLLKLLLLRFRT